MLGVEVDDLHTLVGSSHFLNQLQHMLRLTSENKDVLDQPPGGLAQVLTHYMQQNSYNDLIETLKSIEKSGREAYIGAMNIK